MVVLRLRRDGSKGRPFYRIVATDKRSPRDGRFIEIIGTYNPMSKEEGDNFTLDLEKADKWLGNGAQPSETVASIIKKAKKSAESAEAA